MIVTMKSLNKNKPVFLDKIKTKQLIIIEIFL
jgi:hypothetical protein